MLPNKEAPLVSVRTEVRDDFSCWFEVEFDINSFWVLGPDSNVGVLPHKMSCSSQAPEACLRIHPNSDAFYLDRLSALSCKAALHPSL